MADTRTPECPNCKRLMPIIEQLHATYGKRITELEGLVLKLQGRIEALEAENARLRKDSSNSRKPPRQRRASLERHREACAVRAAPREEALHRRPAGALPAPARAIFAGRN